MFAWFPCMASGLPKKDAASPIPPGSCAAEHPPWRRASLAVLAGPGYPQPVPLVPDLPSYSTAGPLAAASQATPPRVLLISSTSLTVVLW